jgi:hypothetical protein
MGIAGYGMLPCLFALGWISVRVDGRKECIECKECLCHRLPQVVEVPEDFSFTFL